MANRERILQTESSDGLGFGPPEETGDRRWRGIGIDGAILRGESAAGDVWRRVAGLFDLLGESASDEVEAIGGPRLSFLFGPGMGNDEEALEFEHGFLEALVAGL